MDGRMGGSLTKTENLHDFYTTTFKAARRRNVDPIPHSVRTFCKRSSRTRRWWKTITHLQHQQGFVWHRNMMQPIRETCSGPYHGSSKAQTLFPEPSCHRPDILPIKKHPTQTRTLRMIDEVGRWVERTPHRLSTSSGHKILGISWLHCRFFS